VINDFASAAHVIAGATGKDAPIAIPNLVGVAVYQGRLYTRATVGDVLAFDLATHKLVWKTSVHGYPSSLDVASPTGVFFVDDAAILRMLDPATASCARATASPRPISASTPGRRRSPSASTIRSSRSIRRSTRPRRPPR
jgi:hypothetical protein